VTQSRRDLTGRQQPGGGLVEQRLEEMVVSPVDEGDIDIFPAEQAGRRKAAETATDNDHTVARTGSFGRL
jgi:hypothetical protein